MISWMTRLLVEVIELVALIVTCGPILTIKILHHAPLQEWNIGVYDFLKEQESCTNQYASKLNASIYW